MKRALAIAVAVCTLGVAGFGIGPITGSWTATISLLPTPTTLTSELILNYPVAGFTVVSETDFDTAGLATQRFGLTGAFGPFTIAGDMWFDAAPVMYERSRLTTTFDFGGISVSGDVRHWVPGEYPADWMPGIPTDPCPVATPAQPGNMLYTFSTTVAPVTVRTRFLDCSEGIEFFDSLITLTGLPLCCGITYGAVLSFTKAGFGFVEFTGLSIPIGLGVVFDITVRYAVALKTVTIIPRLPDVAACLSVWWTPITDTTEVPGGPIWSGIELDGFRIRCELGDCNFLEYIHAFDVTEMNRILPAADDFRTAEGEYQLIRLRFCGPGCCGGTWTADSRIFFGTGGGLFDLTRFVFGASIPVMTNLSVTASAALPAVSPGIAPALSIGWTLTF